jgi:hypothetical protein
LTSDAVGQSKIRGFRPQGQHCRMYGNHGSGKGSASLSTPERHKSGKNKANSVLQGWSSWAARQDSP